MAQIDLTNQSQPVTPDRPAKYIRYFGAANTARAVYSFPEGYAVEDVRSNKFGIVALWDTKEKRDVARLETDCSLSGASFSPDGQRVVTVSAQSFSRGEVAPYMNWYSTIRVWNTPTGQLIHELYLANGKTSNILIGSPFWSRDGQTIIATDSPGGWLSDGRAIQLKCGIDIWDARTGQLIGKISAPNYQKVQLNVLKDGRFLATWDENAYTIFKLDDILKQISTFKRSLQN